MRFDKWLMLTGGVIVSGCLITPQTAFDPSGAAFASYGVDAAFVPSYDEKVSPGALTQALLDSKPNGTRFALEPGIHRLTSPLRPRANQQVLGYPGAVLRS